MLFWKKKEVKPLDLSWLVADMHSHLLPGIDDGSQDMESSLELIKGLVKHGYKKIVTTPHIFWEMYPNTSEIIKEKTEELKVAVAAEGISVEITAAAEYFIDEHFEIELKDKIPLLTVKDNMVLVEFSMLTQPLDLTDILFEMQMQNYQPIIAHPERYTYLRHKKEFFDDLKNSGCFFQLNLLALCGIYGHTVQELAEYLLRKNYYDFAGTDMHHVKHLEALQKLSGSPLYLQLQQSKNIKNRML
ncbi:MAG: CpsB/CapC family capsule biosynthesis tyrosine phosphatase [Chitinophagaceae bacterium]